jgi:hypothetical protein
MIGYNTMRMQFYKGEYQKKSTLEVGKGVEKRDHKHENISEVQIVLPYVHFRENWGNRPWRDRWFEPTRY